MRQTIRLTENELKRAISSTLRNTRQRTTRGVVNEVMDKLKMVNEISGDMALRAYNAADDQVYDEIGRYNRHRDKQKDRFGEYVNSKIGKDGFYPYGVIRFVYDIDDDGIYDNSYIDYADDPNSFNDIDYDRFDISDEGVYALTAEGQQEIEHENTSRTMNDYQRQHSWGFGKPMREYELFRELIDEPLYTVKIS